MSPLPEPNRRQVLGMMAAAGSAVPLVGAFAGAPTADASPTRPNIMILMTDQERADVALPHGFALPARERLAARGVRFGMHHTPTAPCSPARSTMFTGLQAPVNGVLDNVGNSEYMSGNFNLKGANAQANASMSTSIPTLGTVMKKAGYHTAYIGKWHLSDPVGTDVTALSGYGFDEAIDILGGGSPDEGLEHDPGVAQHAISWLQQHRDDTKPWLCVVSMINPHDMMFCPRFYRLSDVNDYGAGLPVNFEQSLATKPHVQSVWRVENQAVGGFMPENLNSSLAKDQWRQWGNWYLHLLDATDTLMTRVLDAMSPAQSADTVIVQVADHGELGGAHGLRQKGAMIYRENLRVPLVISDPRLPAAHGATVTATPTTHVDLVPTIAALAGTDASTVTPTVGKNLTGLLRDPALRLRESVLVTSDAKSSGALPGVKYCIRGAITEQYSFGRYSTADHITGPASEWEYELYDRHRDPWELDNLAYRGGARSLVADMNALVDELESAELKPLQ